MRPIVAASIALVLAACGDRPQELTGGAAPDTPNWQGTSNAYAAPGWKAGDRKAWEDHLRVRTQQGQNEYLRGGQG
ncbi:MAG: hypothetical protein HYZ20_03485 [Burkholderiales bacterium]|nr:hypothetical protein [Burkholderiales bacterium]